MTNTITKERRDAIRAAAEKATPGPWEDRHDDEVWTPADELIGTFRRSEDSSFVAICRPSTAIAFLDALDAAEARAAQADHAASCLADMVKELQAAAEVKMREPVGWVPVSIDTGTVFWNEFRPGAEPDPSLVNNWERDYIGGYPGGTQVYSLKPLYAAPPAAEPVIPEGWVLVPREPTKEMVDVVQDVLKQWGMTSGRLAAARLAIEAALAAAPALASEKEAE